jgi:hypothetical protein
LPTAGPGVIDRASPCASDDRVARRRDAGSSRAPLDRRSSVLAIAADQGERAGQRGA